MFKQKGTFSALFGTRYLTIYCICHIIYVIHCTSQDILCCCTFSTDLRESKCGVQCESECCWV